MCASRVHHLREEVFTWQVQHSADRVLSAGEDPTGRINECVEGLASSDVGDQDHAPTIESGPQEIDVHDRCNRVPLGGQRDELREDLVAAALAEDIVESSRGMPYLSTVRIYLSHPDDQDPGQLPRCRAAGGRLRIGFVQFAHGIFDRLTEILESIPKGLADVATLHQGPESGCVRLASSKAGHGLEFFELPPRARGGNAGQVSEMTYALRVTSNRFEGSSDRGEEVRVPRCRSKLALGLVIDRELLTRAGGGVEHHVVEWMAYGPLLERDAFHWDLQARELVAAEEGCEGNRTEAVLGDVSGPAGRPWRERGEASQLSLRRPAGPMRMSPAHSSLLPGSGNLGMGNGPAQRSLGL